MSTGPRDSPVGAGSDLLGGRCAANLLDNQRSSAILKWLVSGVA